jgi:hypothetical protein
VPLALLRPYYAFFDYLLPSFGLGRMVATIIYTIAFHASLLFLAVCVWRDTWLRLWSRTTCYVADYFCVERHSTLLYTDVHPTETATADCSRVVDMAWGKARGFAHA